MTIRIPLSGAFSNWLASVLSVEKPVASAIPVVRDLSRERDSVCSTVGGNRLSAADRADILKSLGSDHAIGCDPRARQVERILAELCPGERLIRTVN